MPKKMTHAQAKRELHQLAMQKMMIWSEFVRYGSELAHHEDDDCVIAIISSFDDYRNTTREYDRRLKELTS